MVLSHDPNWLRAGNWFQKTDYADLAIVGVGASKSALTPNRAHKTPAAIREALLKYSTYNASTNIELSTTLSAGDLGDVKNPDNQSSTIKQLTNFYQQAKTVILLGGDNSITYSGVAALFESYKPAKIGLITLDAHHDLRDGYSNGSPIKQLLDEGLPGKNIVQIGINDFANSKFYADRAKQAGIKVLHRKEFNKSQPEQIAKRALSNLSKCAIIYIDIDMDVCDRSVVPAAPAAMPGGISADEIRKLVAALSKDRRTKLFDITELDATIDSLDQRSVRLAALLILEIAASKAGKL
ncbi:MAG: arginase family protein [Actinomycetales bacterium]